MGDRKLLERIVRAVARFADTGYGDVRKLEGTDREYRLRVGEWRVRFDLTDDNAMLVLRVLPRGGAYRD